jgi:predicted ABC-type ATPase
VAPAILEALGIEIFVNADVIARGLSAFNPDAAAFEAGRLMLRRLDELAEERADFAFESTLASRSFAPWLARLKEKGYMVTLTLVWAGSANTSVERVASRVSRGGHNVDPDVVARRHQRSLRNFFELYMPLADRWVAISNVGREQRDIAIGRGRLVGRVYDAELWERLKSLGQEDQPRRRS